MDEILDRQPDTASGLRRLRVQHLRFLALLARLGSLTACAKALHLSQPAVSSALGRLRGHLGDELFLRTQGGMTPTPYALQLAEPVAMALDGLQQALNVRAAFDPLTSTRSFTLAMTDVGEMYFLPVLVDALTRAAPGVTLQVVSVTQASLKEDMATGRIDLAMGLLPQLQAGFFQQALFRQKYICLMRKAHPLAAKNKLDLSALCVVHFSGSSSRLLQCQCLVKSLVPAIGTSQSRHHKHLMRLQNLMLSQQYWLIIHRRFV